MKKILTAILLMVYFTVSTGFVVCAHYCMNRFTSVELGSGKDKKCTKCGMHKKNNGCCRDEVKMVKLQQIHTAPQVISADFSLIAPLPLQINYILSPLVNRNSFDHYLVHGPPRKSLDLYTLHCVFRI